MEMPRPGLKMRDRNKNTHPAVNAGVEKKSRRTPAQMQQARANEATAKSQANLDHYKAKRHLSAVEDKQNQEDIVPPQKIEHARFHAVEGKLILEDDIADAKNTNHLPEHQKKLSTLAFKAVEDAMDSGDGDDLVPKAAESAMGSGAGDNPDSEDESDHDEDELSKKKKKQAPGTTCVDIIASRNTRDGSGTPAVPADNSKKRKAKEKTAGKPQKKAKLTKKKSGLKAAKSKSEMLPVLSAEDNSMVTQDQQEEERSSCSLPHHHPASCTEGTDSQRDTRRLCQVEPQAPPPGTSDQFTDEVVPLACELAGSLEVKPWAKLTVVQIQAIIDRVYGEGEHVVTAEGPWVGLVSYRLNDWRHGIGAQPHKAMADFIDSYETSDGEDAEEDANDDNHDAVDTAEKPLKFKFNTHEGIAEFVEWFLQPHAASRTMAFHWKTWGNGVDKKGFLQSYLILHALAYHFAWLEIIPGGYERLKAYTESALLMLEQGVHHELLFWRTGEYVNPNTPAHYFSIDNYADTVKIIETAQGKKKLVWRATKFLSTVQKWDETHWEEVIGAAKEFIELLGRKRAQTASCSGSEAGDNAILSDNDAVMVLSD
ncbi:hypothetical protein B0H10DRAFT_2239869 [Mycena sp. CBHHK59/15]|nr:hypothetical protein B0H10DRAFT_2239869 [Mycena sp. CBHHK59/15]